MDYQLSREIEKAIRQLEQLQITMKETMKVVQDGFGKMATSVSSSTKKGGSAIDDFTKKFEKMVPDAIAKQFTDNGYFKEAVSGLTKPLVEEFEYGLLLIKPVIDGMGSLIGTLGLPIAGIVAAIKTVNWLLEENKKRLEAIAQEKYEARFGAIAYSLEEIERYAKALTTTDYTMKIEAYVDEHKALERFQQDVESTQAKVEKSLWKLSVGLEYNEGDLETIKSDIRSYVRQSIDTLEQEYYTVSLGLNSIVDPSTPNGQALKGLIDGYYITEMANIKHLGDLLETALIDAFDDGIIDEIERTQITNLLDAITESRLKLSKAMHQADLELMRINLKDFELTPETYAQMKAQTSEITDRYLKDAETAFRESHAAVTLQLEAELEGITDASEIARIKADYDELYYQPLAHELSMRKLEIKFDEVSFYTDPLNEQYNEAMSVVRTNVIGVISDIRKEGDEQLSTMGELLVDKPGEMIERMGNVLSGQIGIVANTLAEDSTLMWENLRPDAEQMNSLALEAFLAGETIPQEMLEGLESINVMGALAGEEDSLLFLLGQQLAESPDLEAMLQAAKDAGELIDERILLGIHSKRDDLIYANGELMEASALAIEEATAHVEDAGREAGEAAPDAYVDEIGKHETEIQKATDEAFDVDSTAIVQSGHDAGYDFGDGIAQAVHDAQPTISKESRELTDILANAPAESDLLERATENYAELATVSVESYAQAVEAATPRALEAVTQLYETIKQTMEEGLGIAAHSVVFEEYGVATIDGYNLGIEESIPGNIEMLGSWLEAVLQWSEEELLPIFRQELWEDHLSGVREAFVSTFERAIRTSTDLINRFIDKVNQSLFVSWDSIVVNGQTVVSAGRARLATLPKIPLLATGGIPDFGQLFVAREAGAELVGGFGSQTGVMNNDQIVDSVSRGVYNAVKAAMPTGPSAGGEFELKVYLDGREIAATVEKHQKERGRTILPGGVAFSV